jgi:hypothetical protein
LHCWRFSGVREIKQHAVRAEVGKIVELEIINRRIIAPVQQRDPVIVGADVHAALVRANHRRRLDRNVVRCLIRAITVGLFREVVLPVHRHEPPIGPQKSIIWEMHSFWLPSR